MLTRIYCMAMECHSPKPQPEEGVRKPALLILLIRESLVNVGMLGNVCSGREICDVGNASLESTIYKRTC